MLTNEVINPADAITGDEAYTCTNGYHFRMASTGTWNTTTNTWSSVPQAEIDQAETPETALGSTNNLISTQQAPASGRL